MADKKISDFTAATSIAAGDLIEIETAGGNSRKVTGANAFLSLRGALAKKAADQTGANFTTLTAVTWDSETGGYDTDSIHDNSTNPSRMSVPSGVSYVQLYGNIRIDNKTAADWVQAIIQKTGANVIGLPNVFFEPGSSQVQWNFCSAPIAVTGGTDYFEMKIQAESDTAIDINSTFSWFAMRLIA